MRVRGDETTVYRDGRVPSTSDRSSARSCGRELVFGYFPVNVVWRRQGERLATTSALVQSKSKVGSQDRVPDARGAPTLLGEERESHRAKKLRE